MYINFNLYKRFSVQLLTMSWELARTLIYENLILTSIYETYGYLN